MVGATLFLLVMMGIMISTIWYSRRIMYKRHKGYIDSVTNYQDRMRNAITAQVNDNILADVHTMRIKIAMAIKGKEEKQERLLPDTMHDLDSIVVKLKAMVEDLSCDCLNEKGLVKLITEHFAEVNKDERLKCSFITQGRVRSLRPERELWLWRIVQDALYQAIKISKATGIEIKAIYKKHDFEIAIKDNGIGFDPKVVHLAPGINLENMKARASLLGAKFLLNTAPGKGCSINIKIPSSFLGYQIN